METKIMQMEDLKEAAALIRNGELVAFPTETVYGLGADALNPAAVAQVYAAKGRPSDNPLIVHIARPEMVYDFAASVPSIFEKLAAKFWPGPLTMIFKIPAGSLPGIVTGELSTAAFRMPDNKATLALIALADRPIVGPSANTSGKPSPTTAAHVYHDLQGKIAGILDGGETRLGLESTVVDLSDYENQGAVILRPGLVTAEELLTVVDKVSFDQHLVAEEVTPKAPGMKYTHYAPDAAVVMVDTPDFAAALAQYQIEGQKAVGLLASRSIIAKYPQLPAFCLTETGNVLEASQHLYEGLRYLDAATPAVKLILAETFPETGKGLAYMNRLKKAAGGKRFPVK